MLLVFVSTVSVLHDRKLSQTRNHFLLRKFLQRPSNSTASCVFHAWQSFTDFPNETYCETMRLRFLVNEAFGLHRSIVPHYGGTLTRRLSQYNDGGLGSANVFLRLPTHSRNPQFLKTEMERKIARKSIQLAQPSALYKINGHVT